MQQMYQEGKIKRAYTIAVKVNVAILMFCLKNRVLFFTSFFFFSLRGGVAFVSFWLVFQLHFHAQIFM